MGSIALNSSDHAVESVESVDGAPQSSDSEDAVVPSRGPAAQVNALKQEVKRLESAGQEMKTKLEESRLEKIRMNAELESLRKFVNVTDKSDGSEVSSIIKSINDDVYQLASDLVQGWPLRQPRGETRPRGKFRQLSDFISPSLVGSLSKCPPLHPRASILLQYAIQGYLQACVNWFFYNISWTPLGEPVAGIDERMKQSESQVTYGRWRALTYHYAQEGIKSAQEAFRKELLRDASSDICALGILLTGRRLDENQFKEVKEDTKSSLTQILENVHRLAIVMHQNIISSNFHLYLPPPGDPFHSNSHDLPAPLPKDEGADHIVVTLRIGTHKVRRLDAMASKEPKLRVVFMIDHKLLQHSFYKSFWIRVIKGGLWLAPYFPCLSHYLGNSPARPRRTARSSTDENAKAVTSNAD
ncbi:hypothetical protein FRC02_002158 [Tulasnella sp. 418]|nr:hypothetical protein FRC02_002158 [Tulasnella sp. 418]